MDVADRVQSGQPTVRDVLGERAQKMFQDFLEEYTADGELKYLVAGRDLIRPERNTLTVSYLDIEEHSTKLANVIQEHYYQVFPYLCQAVRNFARDRGGVSVPKEFYVAFEDVPTRHK